MAAFDPLFKLQPNFDRLGVDDRLKAAADGNIFGEPVDLVESIKSYASNAGRLFLQDSIVPNIDPDEDDPYLKGMVLETHDKIIPPRADVDMNPRISLSRKINVSGAGLLCGARCVQGLIFTHLQVLPSLELVTSGIIATYENPDDPDHQNFFHFEVIQAYLFNTWNLRVKLCHNGVWYPLPEDLAEEEGIEASIYLDGVHYNYHGVDVVGLPNDDQCAEYMNG